MGGKSKRSLQRGALMVGSQKNKCGNSCKRGCTFPSPKNPSSWSLLETDPEYRFGRLTSKCRF